jgi:hypothetical protein
LPGVKVRFDLDRGDARHDDLPSSMMFDFDKPGADTR